ncbi:flagellin [Acuticoccus sp.]|uniref:flagellin N-terminal helical domain-containing protein n=1 Tax=Acuticoccus sp. TaxID=1904378 RepID=UPI003B521CF0
MTSLRTNTAAMVALQTLSQINHSLNETNNRVSTGLRIAQASDSAAYWAIATTTQSDNGALSAVKDALSIGKATLDVAYNGLDATRDSLQKLKALLISARQPGVDRSNIQAEINGLLGDMQNKVSASVFNGENLLSVHARATDYNPTKSIVASFERSSTGLAISTIDLDVSAIMLIDAANTLKGILDREHELDPSTSPSRMAEVSSSPAAPSGAASFIGSITDLVTHAGRTQRHPSNLHDNPVGDLTDSADDMARLENMIVAVDLTLNEVITGQNLVGVSLARAQSQHNFISTLIDANARAIGALVDANMEEESTRLRALQTQQQLSVESLSVANASAQNILALFR